MKKYELTDETMTVDEVTYHRIRACKDFDVQGYHVKAGDLGGYVESEYNIDQDRNAWVGGLARIGGHAVIRDNARVCGNSHVRGHAVIGGHAWIGDNAEVRKPSHIIVISPIGSRDDCTTFCRSKDNDIIVKCGCFNGNISEFLEKVNKTHGDNKYAAEYRAAAELAKIHIDLEGETE
nr:MAG TPA: Putative transferase, nesg, ydcK, Structural Genomics.38A [Caudoviricetes sp.]